MPISFQRDIGQEDGPLIKELDRVCAEHPEYAERLRAFVEKIRTEYANITFDDLLSLSQFCTTIEGVIDREFPDDQALQSIIYHARLRIFSSIRTEGRQPVLPASDFREIMHRGQSTLSPRERREKAEINDIVQEYLRLAPYLGEELLLDLLLRLKIINYKERGIVASILQKYLGDSETERKEGQDDSLEVFLTSPEEILENATIRAKMRRGIIRHCYRILIQSDGDTLESQASYREPHILRGFLQEQFDILYGNAFPGKTLQDASMKHADLFEEVQQHFRAAADFEIPPYMQQTMTDYEGTEWPLGSWRQRLAIAEMIADTLNGGDNQHGYIGFDAGKGKTWTYIFLYEQQKKLLEKKGKKARMLFFAPKAVIDEVPNRIRPGSSRKPVASQYYTDPNAPTTPTVGVIQSGMTVEQIMQAASCDIVFCAYSMWHVTRCTQDEHDGKEQKISIADLLIQQDNPFTSIAFDEAHLLQGDGKRTQLARKTIREIPDLFTRGNIICGSATPAPGHLAGLRVVMELLSKTMEDLPSQARRSNAVSNDAMLLRQQIDTKIWNLDEMEEWLKEINDTTYPLSTQERDYLQMITDDTSLLAIEKLYLSMLFIRCPRLVSDDETMPWSSLQKTQETLSEYFHQHDRHAVLVTENMLSRFVLRDPEEEESVARPEDCFCTALQKWCMDNGVRYFAIHGGTKEEDRIRIYQEVEQIKNDGGKAIIYAHSACLNLGIDLRFIDGIVSQQWPYNAPELYQLMKRSLRAGNTDCLVTVLAAVETIEEGISILAKEKYAEVVRCLYGKSISDKKVRDLLDAQEVQGTEKELLTHLHSCEQKWRQYALLLHGAGAAASEKFWTHHLGEFTEYLEVEDATSLGDRKRFLAQLVCRLENDGHVPSQDQWYLHSQSMGQSLARALDEIRPSSSHSIQSTDTNINTMIATGRSLDCDIACAPGQLHSKIATGDIQKGAYDLVVLDLFENTSLKQGDASDDMSYSGRVRELLAASKTLKQNGLVVIPLPLSACTETEAKHLRASLAAFGFDTEEKMAKYNGIARSQDNHGEPAFEMHCIVAKKVFEPTEADIGSISPERLLLTSQEQRKVHRKPKKLPTTLPHSSFTIGKLDASQDRVFPLPKKEGQLAYLDRLTKAVATIRTAAASAEAFLEISREQRIIDALSTLKIRCMPHLGLGQWSSQKKGGRKRGASSNDDASDEDVNDSVEGRANTGQKTRRLAFRFTDTKLPPFYPYDPIWKTHE